MTLDPILTLGTDKHIEIFVQGIITVPYFPSIVSISGYGINLRILKTIQY